MDNAPDYSPPLSAGVFQCTGHGWWTDLPVCETLRALYGGDPPNLIVEVLDAGREDS